MQSRRLRHLVVLALAALLTVAATGCESAVARQAAPATSLAPGEPAPRGGTLRVGVLGDLQPKTLLQIGTSPANGQLLANVFDTLVTYDRDDLTPQPALATSWELAPDGRSLTLQLRRDVRFHDGRPFVSADVESSIRAYLDDSWNPQFKRTAAAVTGFDTSDPHTVVLRFEHPLSNVFDLLSVAPIIDGNSLPQLQAGTEFNGTGPFRFSGWRPKSQVQLVRNDAYWGGPPPLDGVDLVVVSDEQSAYSRLRTGQLDVATSLSYHDQELATSRYGFTDVTFTGAEGATYVGVNLTNPALSDVRVRKAIALAIDRDRIITDVYRGSGYVSNLPWPQSSPAFEPRGTSTYGRDLDRARKLLAEHGPVPELTIDYSTSGTYGIVAEIVQSNLADIGLDVKLVPNDYTQQTGKLIAGSFDGLWVLEHGFAQFTPSTLAVSAYPFNAAKNSSNYSNQRYSDAATAAWVAPTPTSATATAAYRELNDRYLADLFLIEIGVTIPKIAAAPSVGAITWDKISRLHLAKTYLTSNRND